jgi:hypothetical protein
LSPPPIASRIKPFPIQWHSKTSEGPNWEDAWAVTDLSALNSLPDAAELFYSRYTNHNFTKVGGWPALIQSGLGGDGDFIFQVASEEKPNFMVGDNGKCYFSKSSSGIWNMQWQCY